MIGSTIFQQLFCMIHTLVIGQFDCSTDKWNIENSDERKSSRNIPMYWWKWRRIHVRKGRILMCHPPMDHKSTRIFFRSVQTDKNGNDPSFYTVFSLFKKRKAGSEKNSSEGRGKRIWHMCWIEIRLKKSDEIILEKAYMGNFQIPNLAMSAKSLQKTVEPNHEGNGQKCHWSYEGYFVQIESTRSLKLTQTAILSMG